jgi:monoamine oxidase
MFLLPALPLLLFPVNSFVGGSAIQTSYVQDATTPNNATVLILGGGVSGIIAARTLYKKGIKDFVIVEARHELGGRLMSYNFSGQTVELGANWVQGTQEGDGPSNPILDLVKKHKVKTQLNNIYESISESFEQRLEKART